MVDASVPAPARSGTYYPDSIILYGVKLNKDEDYGRLGVGQGGNTELRFQLFKGAAPQDRGHYSIVLAYGYAFEGRCYRLDTNRIYIVTGPEDEPAVGCGFDLDLNLAPGVAPPAGMPVYSMWRIRSSTELLELASSFGDAKTLILDANLPGKRSPNSYAITLSMAHRDGRMTRD